MKTPDDWWRCPDCDRRMRTAKFYRDKAHELRICADDTIQNPKLRREWAAMADVYERLAQQAHDIWDDDNDY